MGGRDGGAGTRTAAIGLERPLPLSRRPRPIVGLRPATAFTIAITLTAAYVGFAVWISDSWRSELDHAIGPILAWVIPVMLAYIPGIAMGFFMFTLLVSRYHEAPLTPPVGPWPAHRWPAVTILIAALNEQDAIVATFESIADLSYDGPIEVVLADNNSTDRTAKLADEAARRLNLRYRRVVVVEPGKHRALNAALTGVTTPLVVSVDADTSLYREALTRLIARITTTPQAQHVCTCAGALVPANPWANFLTRMQQWDYRLGINGVKRVQATYNSALVAQGAFSAYWTDDLRAAGGWPDAIGEDIVLTWRLLSARGVVQYEPIAVGVTAVPEELSQLFRQRARWARGMFEGLARNPPYTQPRHLAKFVAGIDYLVPLIDLGLILFWVPGLILFICGYPLIVGWWSMLLLPITLIVFGTLRRWHERHVFKYLGVAMQPDKRGFVGYLFLFKVLSSSASLHGYAQYLSGSRRRWR